MVPLFLCDKRVDMQYNFETLSHSNFDKIENSNGISNSVIFINHYEKTVYKFYQNDPCYTTFVQWCAGRDNKYLPVVELLQHGDEYTKVKMEKLSPITEDEFYELGLFDLINYALDQAEYCDHFIVPTDNLLLKAVERYPGLGETIVAIYTDMVSKTVRIDLHQENIMMRGNTPVIIDPVIPC